MLLTFKYWSNCRTKDIFWFTQEKYTIKTWLYLLLATLSRGLSINVNHGKSRSFLWKNYRKCSKITNLFFLVKIQKPKTYVSSKMHCEETYVFSFSILAKKNEICNFTTQGSFFQIANLEPFWPINGNKYIEFFDSSALKDSTKWGSWGIKIKVIALGRHLKRFWDQNFFWVRSGSSWSRTNGKY